jgi:hypothetical protein
MPLHDAPTILQESVMAAVRPKGIVFVSYAHADRARVAAVVEQLKPRFNVFWDGSLEPGDEWRQVLVDRLREARCVLGLWTEHLDDRSFVTSEVERAVHRGVLLPVKLDSNAYVPLGFDRWHHVDLSKWPGQTARGLGPLFMGIRRMLARSAPKPWSNALPESAGWAIPQSSDAVRDMMQLTEQVSTLGGVLMREDGPLGEVRATLGEIQATYTAAMAAIDRFLAPATGGARSRLKSYLALSGGSLSRLIEDKRGHCSRILELYGRAGGLREWLTGRAVTAKLLAEADQAFGRLATADGDLFASLARIGEVLGDDATDIASLLLAGQARPAADRIRLAQKTLLPVRRQLASAMSQMQRIEGEMGFVPGQPRRKRTRRS